MTSTTTERSHSRTGASLAERGSLRILKLNRRGHHHTRQYWSGHAWQLGTAAYWEEVALSASPPSHYQLGATLREELGACMLGGFGITSSVAKAAFLRLRDAGVFAERVRPDAEFIERLLRTPFTDLATPLRYRFPHQKAIRLAQAMRQLEELPDLPDDRELRNWMMRMPGVGPKTASWVVRNHRSSDQVAILDIHIIRAGTAAGLFDPSWRIASDYSVFEQAFLQWSKHAGLPASLLDACVWASLAYGADVSRDILGVAALSDTPMPVWPVEVTREQSPRYTLRQIN